MNLCVFNTNYYLSISRPSSRQSEGQRDFGESSRNFFGRGGNNGSFTGGGDSSVNPRQNWSLSNRFEKEAPLSEDNRPSSIHSSHLGHVMRAGNQLKEGSVDAWNSGNSAHPHTQANSYPSTIDNIQASQQGQIHGQRIMDSRHLTSNITSSFDVGEVEAILSAYKEEQKKSLYDLDARLSSMQTQQQSLTKEIKAIFEGEIRNLEQRMREGTERESQDSIGMKKKFSELHDRFSQMEAPNSTTISEKLEQQMDMIRNITRELSEEKYSTQDGVKTLRKAIEESSLAMEDIHETLEKELSRLTMEREKIEDQRVRVYHYLL